MNLKLLLWEFNESEICPICGRKLIPHLKGNYTCPKEDCEFN